MTYKESFVEENPHIVYTSEPDTSFDGGSGGELEPGSVTTETIANGAVTAEKIAEGVTDSVYWITLTSDPMIPNWNTGTSYNAENITFDKPLSEIISAIKNGKNPKLRALITIGDISERNLPTYAIFDLKTIIYSESETDISAASFEYSFCNGYDHTCVTYDVICGNYLGQDVFGMKVVYNFQSDSTGA